MLYIKGNDARPNVLGGLFMSKFTTLFLTTAALLCIVLTAASCSDVSVRQTWRKMPGNGLPPHAPAHGRRRKEAGDLKITYDPDRDIYVVVNLPHHYYYNGSYYRLHNGSWQVALKIDGSWKTVPHKLLPPGLKPKQKTKRPPKARGR